MQDDMFIPLATEAEADLLRITLLLLLLGGGLDLRALHVTRDPGAPDRVTIDAEEVR